MAPSQSPTAPAPPMSSSMAWAGTQRHRGDGPAPHPRCRSLARIDGEESGDLGPSRQPPTPDAGPIPMRSPLGKLARLAKVLLAAFPLALLMVCLNPGGGVSQADPLSSCTTTAGVIVVVDFSHWGGNADRVCFAALTTNTTAYDALIAEGFTTAGDAHDGSAFVCRITEPGTGVAEPSVSEDPCTTTPPAPAYWSFWVANAGQGAWSVSPLGVMSLVPQPGSVEYWNFGSDVGEADRPPLPPSAVRATNTTPTTEPITPPPTGASASGGSGSGSGSGGGGRATTPTTPP